MEAGVNPNASSFLTNHLPINITAFTPIIGTCDRVVNMDDGDSSNLCHRAKLTSGCLFVTQFGKIYGLQFIENITDPLINRAKRREIYTLYSWMCCSFTSQCV